MNELKKLIDLKSIITIVICVAMVIFTWKGIIGNEMFIAVGTSIFTYFFTKKNGGEVNVTNTEKDNIN